MPTLEYKAKANKEIADLVSDYALDNDGFRMVYAGCARRWPRQLGVLSRPQRHGVAGIR